MRQALSLVLCLLASGAAGATGVPERIDVTKANAARLGFELVALDSGDPNIHQAVLKFPAHIHGDWTAQRVQTVLLDGSGNQVMESSSDYPVTGASPSVLLGFQPSAHDVTLIIQYFCSKGGGPSCAEAYVIESVKKFLTDK